MVALDGTSSGDKTEGEMVETLMKMELAVLNNVEGVFLSRSVLADSMTLWCKVRKDAMHLSNQRVPSQV